MQCELWTLWIVYMAGKKFSVKMRILYKARLQRAFLDCQSPNILFKALNTVLLLHVWNQRLLTLHNFWCKQHLEETNPALSFVCDWGKQAANFISKMSKTLQCYSWSDLFGEGTVLIIISQYCVNRERESPTNRQMEEREKKIEECVFNKK